MGKTVKHLGVSAIQANTNSPIKDQHSRNVEVKNGKWKHCVERVAQQSKIET